MNKVAGVLLVLVATGNVFLAIGYMAVGVLTGLWALGAGSTPVVNTPLHEGMRGMFAPLEQGPVLLALALAAGAPAIMAGGLLLFRGIRPKLVDAAAVLALMTGVAGLALTGERWVFLVGMVAGFIAILAALRLPLAMLPDEAEAAQPQAIPEGVEGQRLVSRTLSWLCHTCDRTDWFLLGVIVLSLLTLLVSGVVAMLG